jgi:hypothetical protein
MACWLSFARFRADGHELQQFLSLAIACKVYFQVALLRSEEFA